MGWRFGGSVAGLTQLPLAVAVATVRALRRAGVRDGGIKWPNDVLVGGRKLAGILVELRRTGDDEALAVLGVGVNLGMPAGPEAQAAISQPWTEMSAHLLEPVTPDLRNRVCGLLIDELLMAIRSFSDSGFQSFASDWSELDVLRGQDISVDTGKEIFHGVAVGISDRGGLLVACETPTGTGNVKEFLAGEVSVRLFGT
jgi:BirA family biotin operon repressor/biotin-[acetyl-CoA-carboxylase] ligase